MIYGKTNNKMVELRKDYILDRFVILAAERGKRPHEFKQAKKSKDDKAKKCFFCPGNESMTPAEIYRTEKKGKETEKKDKWQIRVFPNKFSAVNGGDGNIKTHNDFFTFADAVGKHEIVVETPNHKKQLADLGTDEFVELFKVYNNRIKEISKEPSVKYVLVFKNHGEEAGTSLLHSHTQIIGYNIIPVVVNKKEEACSRYPSCPYCRIMEIEKTSFRRVHENDSFVCFTPYASRFPYEIWFFPKRHIISSTEMNDDELKGLAELMQKVLKKLKSINASYNFYFHNGTGNTQKFHFHIELTPRLSKWAGFELGSETIINTVSPEDAAEFYRK